MYISHIAIDSFGKLKNKSFRFSNSFNLIYGNNESGKTTLFSFIKFMFYGIKQKKVPLDISFKDKYLPWDGDSLSGSMSFTFKDTEYFLKRYYSTSRNYVELMNLSSGQKVSDNSILNDIGNYFFGVDSVTFTSTAFLSSVSASVSEDKSSEIVSKLTNIFENGNESISYKKIIDEIEDEISKLSSAKRKNAVIPSLKKKIDENTQKLYKLNSISKDTTGIHHTLYELESEKLALTKKGKTLIVDSKKGLPIRNKIYLFIFFLVIILQLFAPLFVDGFYKYIPLHLYRVFVSCEIIGFAAFFLRNRKTRKDFTTNVFNDKIMLENRIKEIDKAIEICQQNLKYSSEISKEVSAVKSEISLYENELSESLKKLDAYFLAKRALQRAYEENKSGFLPGLNLCFEKYAFLLTNGKYSKIKIDDNLNLNVYNGKGFCNILQLSRGSIEQIYLALRIALSDFLFENFSCPLFLDDALSFYDGARLISATDCLLDISSKRQILYATCRENEFDLLKERNVYIINI